MQSQWKTAPLAAAAVALAGAAAAVALAGATAAWAVAGAPTVKTARNATLGSVVVSAHGMTLYHLTSEKGGRIECTGACTASWPPLLVSGAAKPVAGPGIAAAKLGTVKRPDGKVQVTYAGSPLYLYGDDRAAGQAKGEGEGGVWFALAPSGAVVKPAANATPAAGATAGNAAAPGAGAHAGTGYGRGGGRYGSGY
jgi:predicted lipoprotein with Yx(FWY)xxD motif